MRILINLMAWMFLCAAIFMFYKGLSVSGGSWAWIMALPAQWTASKGPAEQEMVFDPDMMATQGAKIALPATAKMGGQAKEEQPLVSVGSDNLLLVLGGESFAAGDYLVQAVSKETLSALAASLQQEAKGTILIEAYTDELLVGYGIDNSDPPGLGLARLRARAIAEVLIRHGIRKEQLMTQGYAASARGMRGDAVMIKLLPIRE